MDSLYTVNHGSIYFGSKIIEELGFILRKDNDSNFTSVKIGETEPLVKIQLPKDQLAQKVGLYDTIVLFSFGKTIDSTIPKENQVKIANFLIEYAADHKLKLQLINDLSTNDFESLSNTFNKISQFVDQYESKQTPQSKPL